MRLAAAAAAAAKVLSCYLSLQCLLSVCLCSGIEGEFWGSLWRERGDRRAAAMGRRGKHSLSVFKATL